ncbi:hypothetical protein Sp245p_32065 (plasmid) [Azospirillum baldaniorum]|uniref:Uncharacterized protein n=1 Tax=Azospirillum baldaniorum TaxID=1064539 RepID=A0A9P1NRX1_9PROT|nr:hypothetical protein Sp245p_32065 [Azospirillum baldaniorum]CCD03545.1 protein of unknown function [Azospirillum baldaniorum]
MTAEADPPGYHAEALRVLTGKNSAHPSSPSKLPRLLECTMNGKSVMRISFRKTEPAQVE